MVVTLLTAGEVRGEVVLVVPGAEGEGAVLGARDLDDLFGEGGLQPDAVLMSGVRKAEDVEMAREQS